MSSPNIRQNPRTVYYAIAGYFILTLLMFGDVLFGGRDLVLSNAGTDIFNQFLSWRKFGFDELRQGNLPLWNPYVFCGAPYFGGFQAALLYPLNALFLFLPVTVAINYSIALHVFLAGVFVFLWASFRKLHPVACFLAGLLWMFSAPYFFHLYAGHLSNLCTMIWAPLLFLAIDGTFEKPSLRWCLLGMFAAAMQVLAGHPQYVFYTAFTAAIYIVFLLAQGGIGWRVILSLGVIGIGAAALTAAQLAAGNQAAKETIRSVGSTIGFASSFSFPPENFITVFAPEFFGNTREVPYWGRGVWWEMVLFSGVCGAMLAAFGALKAYKTKEKTLVLMVLLVLLCALGSNTWLMYVLYYGVPGFGKFRGSSKLIFVAALFLSLLAAIGFDEILRRGKVPKGLIISTFLLAISLAGLGWSIQSVAHSPTGWWRGFTDYMASTTESALALGAFKDNAMVAMMGMKAGKSLYVASMLIAGLATVFYITRFSVRLLWLIPLFAMVEMFIYGMGVRDTFDIKSFLEKGDVLVSVSPAVRVIDIDKPNIPMFFGKSDLWGNDPASPLRLAKFMTWSQGLKPEQAPHNSELLRYNPFYRALRCNYVIREESGGIRARERSNPLPQLVLINKYRILTREKEIFAAMKDVSFDPANELILESKPTVEPDPKGPPGKISLLKSSTDFLDVEADLPSAAILLITDSYTPSWEARSLIDGPQPKYDVVPGDYCLRAIPLVPGHHKLRIEYVSRGFAIGKWISIVSVLVFAVLVIGSLKRPRRNDVPVN